MIQIKIDVEQMKSGRVTIELKIGISKEKPATEAEANVTTQFKGLLEAIVFEMVSKSPGSSLAIGSEDVETLKGIEKLDFKKGDENE